MGNKKTSIPITDVAFANEEIERFGWNYDQYTAIVQTLQEYGCEYLKGREEYTLLKQVLGLENGTEGSKTGNPSVCANTLFTGISGSGVISPLCDAKVLNELSDDFYKERKACTSNPQKQNIGAERRDS